jgi:hypothetical protein
MKKHLKLLAALGVTSILVSSTSIPTFAEDFVLYDENGVHVETKGLTESPSKGTIGLYIENNSDLNLDALVTQLPSSSPLILYHQKRTVSRFASRIQLVSILFTM